MGVKEASHDLILILSAHAQITAINKKQIQSDLNTYVAVFGKQTPIYKGKKISKRYIWSHFKDIAEENMYSQIENRYFLHNAFCFYKRKFLLEHPMPEQYPGKEDRYWAKDILNKGYDYLYNPDLSVNHFYTGNGATWKGIG